MVLDAERQSAEGFADRLDEVILGHMWEVSGGEEPSEAMLMGWASALVIAVTRHFDCCYGPELNRPREECLELSHSVADWLINLVQKG